ncbi:hypothetical protein M406DRAFT_331999 [Cryphonectria parasitica EP155]|uniref:DUF6603 domain-containing protein n=1 Tax=Cryphonectria parasitica (strain ATCC 38755 / EP155) TaxID=660469 RepID=A0A9P4XYS3_CRYP1|nr:uncharacterized protein M406DRAFT_331999 [Cryphonectria parasitica EP155]KAF3763483.1 hypothetical protein M406DRAFT_331999 [Cryphonectria parasitica EP155]
MADIGLNITNIASVRIQFVHIDISGSVHAELHLQGPPFDGYVDVDSKLVSIKIWFGEVNSRPLLLNFCEFLDAVLKPGLSGAGQDTSEDLVVLGVADGAVARGASNFDRPKGEPWRMRAAQVKFRIESKFAVSRSIIGSDLEHGPVQDKNGGRAPIYARLMQNKSVITSTHRIKITGPGKQQGYDQDPPSSGQEDNNLEAVLSNNKAKDSTILHLVSHLLVPPPSRLPDAKGTLPAFNAARSISEGVFQKQADSSLGSSSNNVVVKNQLLSPDK